MTRLTATPAYGRDYKSKAALLTDWEAGKDFILNDMFSRWDGKPFNRDSLTELTLITFRYGKERKVVMLRYEPATVTP